MSDLVETRYARNGDVHLAYQQFGISESGVDLVLMFGSHISIDSMDEEPGLKRFHDRLGSFTRVTRFDHRGIGLSDPIVAPDITALEQGADDAVAVMDAAGIQSAALMADLNSAARAIMLTVSHPERISQLVIVNGTARSVRADGYPFGVPAALLEQFFDIVTEPEAQQQGFDDLSLFAPTAVDDPSFRSWWVRAGRRAASPSVALALLRMDNLADVRDLLALVRVPTLILHREGCLTLSVAHGKYLAEHIPLATFVELPGRDSLYWVGETDQMLHEIGEFLTGGSVAPEPDRVLATVLFSDIVGSTERATTLGDQAWRDRLDAHDGMVRRQLGRFRGVEVKTTGDGFVATFDGPARAIGCGRAIRDGALQLDMSVRVGLHTGEVEMRGDDISGIAVHIGARVMALAQPGEVLVSRTVTDLVAGTGIEFEDRGEHELKGVSGSWRVFAVRS